MKKEFRKVIVNGRPMWEHADGRRMPVFAGGDGSDDDDNNDDDDRNDDDNNTGDNDNKSFTQADVDRIVRDRLKREREKHGDLKEIKEKAAKYDELEEKNKTELDKERTAREKAEKEAEDATERTNKRLIRAEARVQAVDAGVKAERIDKVLKLADLSDIEVDDDGEVDVKAVKSAIEEVLKDVPELKSGTGTKPDADGGPRREDKGTPDVKSRLERVKAKTGIS